MRMKGHEAVFENERGVAERLPRLSEPDFQASECRVISSGGESNRPVVYMRSPKASKEEMARQIQQRDGIGEGLICVLSCVEPCMSYSVVPNRATKELDLKLEQRQCLHLYHYWMHPVLGFMHGRIQTWFPFRIQMCLKRA